MNDQGGPEAAPREDGLGPEGAGTGNPREGAGDDPALFPAEFLWGAATSAYQIEGAPLEDGAGPSIWHRFSHTPGAIENGDTGDVACDHYHRWLDDVKLMERLGLSAYRLSLSWSRLLPEGRGKVNGPGIGFYDRLVDALLERGISPSITLYHWDLPLALDERGGWTNPDSAHWFADYARVAYRALGDRVPFWSTLNEPWVVVDGGYLFGVHAPGHRSRAEAPRAAHHLLRAHAEAVRAFRASGAMGEIGIVVNLAPKDPASADPRDAAAARRADAYMNRHYLDPLYRGAYPEELREIYAGDWPGFTPEEMEPLREPFDFVGINYYTRSVVVQDEAERPLGFREVRPAGAPLTAIGWEVHPSSFTRILRWVQERYGSPPVYVTENGAAFDDPPPAEDGRIDDPRRVSYLREHLRAARAARAAGVDLRGYFAWSLMDNFEWACGFSKRFGLVHVDYATLRRTPKLSAYAYREILETRGAALDLDLERLIERARERRAREEG